MRSCLGHETAGTCAAPTMTRARYLSAVILSVLVGVAACSSGGSTGVPFQGGGDRPTDGGATEQDSSDDDGGPSSEKPKGPVALEIIRASLTRRSTLAIIHVRLRNVSSQRAVAVGYSSFSLTTSAAIVLDPIFPGADEYEAITKVDFNDPLSCGSPMKLAKGGQRECVLAFELDGEAKPSTLTYEGDGALQTAAAEVDAQTITDCQMFESGAVGSDDCRMCLETRCKPSVSALRDCLNVAKDCGAACTSQRAAVKECMLDACGELPSYGYNPPEYVCYPTSVEHNVKFRDVNAL